MGTENKMSVERGSSNVLPPVKLWGSILVNAGNDASVDRCLGCQKVSCLGCRWAQQRKNNKKRKN
ncbi:MAG: hypothetical protein KatS3mg087_1475 [Patescibacteria group bacterium]|nr:MAG: hypothetical protein KatS3mg087_1475 [Patescibacteria group bacterium]